MKTAQKEKTDQAAPLVIPPCFANSFSSESQPGVRGFDILVKIILFYQNYHSDKWHKDDSIRFEMI